MKKESILELITNQNYMLKEIDKKRDRGLEIQGVSYCDFARVSYDIVTIARQNGIDAKVNMQNGIITIYGDLKEEV